MSYEHLVEAAIVVIYVALVIVMVRLHRSAPTVPQPPTPKSYADRQWDAWWSAEDDEVAP